MDPQELTDRGNLLALELRRIVVAHVDAIEVRGDAETIEIMALCIALAEAFVDVRTSAGHTVRGPHELAGLLVRAPFLSAAMVVMHPDRPRGPR